MKMTIKKSSAMRQIPVEVTIAVRKFKDVLAIDVPRGGRGTEYVLKLRRKDPRVFIKGDVIYVRPPGATIRFTIASSAGDKERYYPNGIAFVRESERSESERQRLGMLNFPQSETHVEARRLTITDAYKDRAPCVRYKFSVVVQRGSDGKIGIIDPIIEHDNSH